MRVNTQHRTTGYRQAQQKLAYHMRSNKYKIESNNSLSKEDKDFIIQNLENDIFTFKDKEELSNLISTLIYNAQKEDLEKKEDKTYAEIYSLLSLESYDLTLHNKHELKQTFRDYAYYNTNTNTILKNTKCSLILMFRGKDILTYLNINPKQFREYLKQIKSIKKFKLEDAIKDCRGVASLDRLGLCYNILDNLENNLMQDLTIKINTNLYEVMFILNNNSDTFSISSKDNLSLCVGNKEIKLNTSYLCNIVKVNPKYKLALRVLN